MYIITIRTSLGKVKTKLASSYKLAYIELEFIYSVIDVYFCVQSQARTSGTGEYSGHRGEEEQHLL